MKSKNALKLKTEIVPKPELSNLFCEIQNTINFRLKNIFEHFSETASVSLWQVLNCDQCSLR